MKVWKPKWSWEGMVFVDTPLQRRVVDKEEAEKIIAKLWKENLQLSLAADGVDDPVEFED